VKTSSLTFSQLRTKERDDENIDGAISVAMKCLELTIQIESKVKWINRNWTTFGTSCSNNGGRLLKTYAPIGPLRLKAMMA
jgi:hypothetical protein